MVRKEFLIGCNYWASNAGCFMWKNFDAQVVEKDLRFLVENGVNCIRIFPTWDDFQSLMKVPRPQSDYFNKYPFQMRVDEKPMFFQKYESGLSEEKLNQFKYLLDKARENGLKVIVSFITGWMSGRRFVPTPFLEKDLVSDPEVILWQSRFIKDLISEIKHYDNIIAWEPGNECNCLTTTASEYACEAWILAITSAIKLADNTRPVYSGMHGTAVQGKWNLCTQGKYFDMVTTHPYPCFTPYCSIEGLREMRASLHAAVESSYYRGISNQDCLVEEVGTLGPHNLSDEFTPEYFEKSLMTSFAIGATGYLWWCAFDQEFDFAPYDTNYVERKLGLAYSNEKGKPVLKQMKKMASVVKEIGSLPMPDFDAVVVFPTHCDAWKLAYGAEMLAIQNGRNLDFVYEEQPLKTSDYYILPCLNELSIIQLKNIEERVKNGAHLLITGNGTFADFEPLTGLKVAARGNIPIEKKVVINGTTLTITSPVRLKTVVGTAKVLLQDEAGEIFVSENQYGKGSVMFCNAPLEDFYTTSYLPENTALSEIYSLFFKEKEQIVSVESTKCMVTTHRLQNGNVAVILNNYDERKELPITVSKNYSLEKILYAEVEASTIRFNESYAYIELTVGKEI